MLPSIIVSFVSNILSLFGIKGKEAQNKDRNAGWRGSNRDEGPTVRKNKKNEHRKKVFDNDEGEYVDFEEIE